MFASKGNILVVDDDKMVLMNYSDILEDAGYVVSTASSLKQAWNIAESRPFGLMICDHDLGDGKGLDLIGRLIKIGIRYPVLYLTAATSAVLKEAASVPLIERVLSKPISKEILLSAVRESFSHSEDDTYPRIIGNEERNMLLSDYRTPEEEGL